MHDKKIIDQEETIQKSPTQTCLRFDLGYQGIVVKNTGYYLVLPIKKSRKKEPSPLAKKLNILHGKHCVIVENVLSRLKKFKIYKYTYIGPIQSYN